VPLVSRTPPYPHACSYLGLYSGSTCKEGEAEGIVISTGANTFLGRVASLVGQEDDTASHCPVLGVKFAQNVRMKAEELQRMSRIQVGHTGQMLTRYSSRGTA
jgi:hypothetical protein